MGLEGLPEANEVKNEQTFAAWLKAHTHTEEEMVQLRAIARAANAEQGIPDGPPDVSLKEMREDMLKNGWKPEDCIFQKELMRMRYGNCNEDE